MKYPITGPRIASCTMLAIAYTVPAIGLGQETDLVIVDIKPIAQSLAENIRTEPSSIPLTVKAPAAVAADVCGISATELRRVAEEKGTAGCVATTSTRALEELVRDRAGK